MQNSTWCERLSLIKFGRGATLGFTTKMALVPFRRLELTHRRAPNVRRYYTTFELSSMMRAAALCPKPVIPPAAGPRRLCAANSGHIALSRHPTSGKDAGHYC
jgi:hypothetical protein